MFADILFCRHRPTINEFRVSVNQNKPPAATSKILNTIHKSYCIPRKGREDDCVWFMAGFEKKVAAGT